MYYISTQLTVTMVTNDTVQAATDVIIIMTKCSTIFTIFRLINLCRFIFLIIVTGEAYKILNITWITKKTDLILLFVTLADSKHGDIYLFTFQRLLFY